MRTKNNRFLQELITVISTAALAIGLTHSSVALADEAPSIWLGLANEKNRIMEWPGSGLEISFTGTSVSVTLEDNGKNSLVVDNDGDLTRLQLERGKKTYKFIGKASERQHRLKLIRRTEKMFGPTRLLSLTADGKVLPGKRSKRQILAVGDSISAGYGIEGTDQSCKFSADTQNQYLTYPAVAARRLGADITTLATSGIRVSPAKPSDVSTMPFVFQQAYPKGKSFDVVIVNLGTNDFSQKNKPDNFVNAYAAFMGVIRNENPQAWIYAALGPMLSDKQFNEASAAIQQAVEIRHQIGDRRIKFLSLRTKSSAFGCNWHPNAETHARLAETLTTTLQQDLDWTRDAAN